MKELKGWGLQETAQRYLEDAYFIEQKDYNHSGERGGCMGDLVGMEKLREFFETVILSGRVKGGEPVSAMLIADPERGKTSIATSKASESFRVLTDITGKGLQFLCQMDARCTHFVVNDMAVVMAHGAKTRDYFFSILLAATEEGIRGVANPEGFKETTKGGRRGFVGCITSSQARDNRNWWYKRGLARRMIPFHFDYSSDLVLKIKAEINKDNGASFSTPGILKVPEAHIDVKMEPREIKEIDAISTHRAEKLGQLGISMLKNYRILARAHAISRTWKAPVVNQDDIQFLKRIDPYIDWEEPAIL